MPDPKKNRLTFQDACRELQLSEEELEKLVANGEIASVKEGDTFFFKPEVIQQFKKNRKTEPTIILSQPDPMGWRGLRGRVTDLIDERVSADEVSNTDAYLCGGRPMIEEAKRLLINKGMKVDHIRHENFF